MAVKGMAKTQAGQQKRKEVARRAADMLAARGHREAARLCRTIAKGLK